LKLLGAIDVMPPAKRAKLDGKEPIKCTHPLFSSAEGRAQLAGEFSNSQPYTHTQLSPFCQDGNLREVLHELTHNIQANLKESDLFKVYQTGDLANVTLDGANAELAQQVPSLLALRDYLYSPDFRQFVRDVTGCVELSGRTDCSCNLYDKGCHLLCHDDVIGTRKVSYIIYLSPPDDPWHAEDGGALELYPGTNAIPDTIPTVNLLPTWNSMCFFTVQPGVSFHSVQEVYSDKPRLSISGWYHSPVATEGVGNSTVNQLISYIKPKDTILEAPFQPYSPAPGASEGASEAADPAGAGESGGAGEAAPPAPLSETELELLRQWINPAYLSPQAAEQVRAQFLEASHVSLRDFLLAPRAAAATAAALHADGVEHLGGGRVPTYTAGVCGGWALSGPTHMQRFLLLDEGAGSTAKEGKKGTADAAKVEAAAAAGQELRGIRDQLVSSPAFARLLHLLTGLQPTARRAAARRFRPGMDYSVATYGTMTPSPRLDAVLCFVDEGQGEGQGEGEGGEKGSAAEQKVEVWGSGEAGGFESYIEADEDDSADASEVRTGGGGCTVAVLRAVACCCVLLLAADTRERGSSCRRTHEPPSAPPPEGLATAHARRGGRGGGCLRLETASPLTHGRL
jgi:Rps23 Pro-64 3,4-dihydroxylase Tpa1-like proline 4-hydroxylase